MPKVIEFRSFYIGNKAGSRSEFVFDPRLKQWIGPDSCLIRQNGWHLCKGDSVIPCEYTGTGAKCGEWDFPELLLPPEDIIKGRRTTARNKRQKPSASHKWLPKAPGVGACLAELVSGFLATKAAGGCGCTKFAAQMDAWGPEGCESRREEVITHLVSNTPMLVKAIQESKIPGCGLVAKLVDTPAAAPILKIGANWLLTKAIANHKEKVQALAHTVAAAKSKALTSKIVMPVSSHQKQLLLQANSRVPVADPFTDTPIVHFGAHLWPVKTYWRKHVDLWNELAGTIEGKCLVGVVVDKESDSLADVQASLSDRFEVFQMDNTPQGENPTFRELQERIPSGQDDVLIYCHGKGVRAHTAASESVQIWTEMMYETVIFNQEKMLQKLSEGYKIFGSFRTFGNVPLTPHNQWHYSGTFFAVRAKHIPGKTVKTGYGGVEAWPGDHIEAADSWCEFTDGPGFKFGYDLNALYPAIVDAQMQWEVDRLGGPRCEQHKRELDWFLDYLVSDDRVLVIGSKHGGLEHQIKTHCSTIETLSVDIAPQPDNTQPMIVGSSLDHDIQAEILKRGPFSVVFIDGDHSYQGASEDWSFADQVVAPRLIALHDIADAIKHRREGCEVDKLWKEIKQTYSTSEKIVGCGWGGIGVVHL